MKIRNFLFVFAAVLIFFLPIIGAFAQTGVTADTLTNALGSGVVGSFLAEYGQYAYVLLVWVGGALVKRYGDSIPLLNQLTETSYRVLAFGLLLAVGFWQFGGGAILDYLKNYGMAAVIYQLGLKDMLTAASDGLLGVPTKKGQKPHIDK